MVTEVCAVKQLEIAKKEWTSTAKQLKYMIKAKEAGKLTDIQIKKIFDEWVVVAQRLKKGSIMLNEVEKKIQEEPSDAFKKRFHALYSLYVFLLKVLAFYDIFFRMTLEKEHYERLQMVILKHLG